MQSQSVLPPATKLFLDSLKAGAKLQSPTGQPTVAAQAAQSAGIIPPQQPQQPQQQGGVPPVTPEAGQEGLAGILDQLKQAQQTGPSVAQNQQQAQQQQLAQQAAQMVQKQGPQPTQNMAEGGLAGLPVDIGEFAEGGVIGYAEGGRTLGETIYSGLSSMIPEEMNIFSPNRRIPSHPREEAFLAAQEKQAQPEEAGGEKPGLKFDYAPNTNIAKVINTLRAEMDRVTNPAEKAQLRTEIERLYGQLPTSTPTAAPPDGGLGALAQSGARREAAPDGPALSGIMAEMQGAGFTKPDMSEQNRLYAADRKLRENRPDFGAQDIATATRIQEMAQAQDARQLGLAQIAARPLIRGGGARTAEVTANFEAAKAGRDAAYLRLIDASKQAEYARQVGDNDALRKADAEIVKAQQEYQKLSANLAANMYSSQAGIATANIAANSREEVAAERVRGLLESAGLRAQLASAQKPVGLTTKEVIELRKYVAEQFNPGMIKNSPEALKAIADVGEQGKRLIVDIKNGNITAEELASHPIVLQARGNVERDIKEASKYGAPATPYTEAER